MSNCCATFSRGRRCTPSPTGDHRDARAVDETDTRRPAGAPATLTLLTFPLVAFRFAGRRLEASLSPPLQCVTNAQGLNPPTAPLARSLCVREEGSHAPVAAPEEELLLHPVRQARDEQPRGGRRARASPERLHRGGAQGPRHPRHRALRRPADPRDLQEPE